MFECRVLRRIFGPKREVEEGCKTMNFITCTLSQV
jgi:hypothetical protein